MPTMNQGGDGVPSSIGTGASTAPSVTSEARLREIFRHATIGMSVTDALGHFVEVNPAFCEITGYSAEELTRMTFMSITHADDRELNLEIGKLAESRGQSAFQVKKRYVRKDGTVIWVRVSVTFVENEIAHAINLIEDISASVQAEELAQVNEQRWQLALSGTADGIWDWDARKNTVYFSPRWKEMLGYADSDVPNRPEIWEELMHPDDLPYAKGAVLCHLEGRTAAYCAEYRLRCRDGNYKWILARGKAIRDASGELVRFIGAHTDINERKCVEAQMRYEASHDALTGLVNRRSYLSHLDEAIAQAKASGGTLYLCVCDIDHFKLINDREGHQAGDDVLVTLAGILRDGIRQQDLAGRMGGDEFLILLPSATKEEALRCIERILCRLHSVAFGGNSGSIFSVTASFGITEWEHTDDAAALIRKADSALYGAKAHGRDSVYCDSQIKNLHETISRNQTGVPWEHLMNGANGPRPEVQY